MLSFRSPSCCTSSFPLSGHQCLSDGSGCEKKMAGSKKKVYVCQCRRQATVSRLVEGRASSIQRPLHSLILFCQPCTWQLLCFAFYTFFYRDKISSWWKIEAAVTEKEKVKNKRKTILLLEYLIAVSPNFVYLFLPFFLA